MSMNCFSVKPAGYTMTYLFQAIKPCGWHFGVEGTMCFLACQAVTLCTCVMQVKPEGLYSTSGCMKDMIVCMCDQTFGKKQFEAFA